MPRTRRVDLIKKYSIEISSGSHPRGGAPLHLVLNPATRSDGKRYNSIEEFRQDLIECGIEETVIDFVLQLLRETSPILIQQNLSAQSVIRLCTPKLFGNAERRPH